MLTDIIAAPVQQPAGMIVALEGEAVTKYSRRLFRETLLVPYTEPVLRRYERKLPLKLAGAEHMIAVPTDHA
ncbi:hypothetical protein COLU111180_06380 [Cohnella lubricantis]|uniref:Uncharacterized protein n=1 Tax=Cohnella lubricantis TaxID=2163172 RepID=A0A841T7J7_9BACL|nr:hypothetical protein [Cohnella lubricantis]MBB6677493.1 hypothetical protein [Cohnella lubricantis]MBP2116621.1 hypothetical protein [Cohnella lubricantis]